MSMMLLQHATHTRNVPSICKHGLLVDKATGKLPAVWLHDRAITEWAILHVCKRHGWNPADVVLFPVLISRRMCRRTCFKDVWYTPTNVPSTALLPAIGAWDMIGQGVPENE